MTPTISLDELRARIDRGPPVTVVEALGADFYAAAHLPGALNLPTGASARFARAVLPSREDSIIVYCSAGGVRSRQLAARLRAMGYRDVRVYLGGKEEWAEAGLPLEGDLC